MRVYNNNDEYGDCGPFDTESFEALADEMRPTFEMYADDWEDGEVETPHPDIMDREDYMAHLRREFIAGLTEVCTLAMTNGTTDYEVDVHDDCDDFHAAAIDAWPYVRDYAGTCKYSVLRHDGEPIEEGTF